VICAQRDGADPVSLQKAAFRSKKASLLCIDRQCIMKNASKKLQKKKKKEAKKA